MERMTGLAIGLTFALLSAASRAGEAVSFGSPGFPPSRLDSEGRLLEDWGALKVSLGGEGVVPPAALKLEEVKLEGTIPAARAGAACGPVALELTAFRAPIWPSGLDVLTVKVDEKAGKEISCRLSLALPEGARQGNRTLSMGGRTVLALPFQPTDRSGLRDWGYSDEATSLLGWARPAAECDPAFRNIRAGLGGVPILYLFKVEPKGAANVVLGFCESHWAQSGQRPFIAKVEGAPQVTVDPVARWGQHVPGALPFQGRDENGDGRLEVSVLPSPGAADQNPILNVIWIFPPGQPPNLEQVIAGKLNAATLYYVDAGGEKDQSIYPPGKIDILIRLKAGGSEELTFLVASPGGSAPVPDRTAWTAESLRRAAREVWRDWKER